MDSVVEFLNWFIKNELVIAMTALMAIFVAWGMFYEKVGRMLFRPIGMFFYSLATVADKVTTLSTNTNAAIADISAKVDGLTKEMKTNGGSTIKDHLLKIDAKLSIAEGQRHLVLNQGVLPYFMTDARGRCTWANTAYLDMTGMSLTEVLGDNWTNVIYSADRANVYKEWTAAVTDKRDFNLTYKYQITDRNGGISAPFSVQVLAYPSFNHIGELVGYNGIVKRVTVR